MHAAFFLLPEQKQEAIKQAGYEVFAGAPYAKAKMSDLAWKAGISKSLLFYYFKNKRELYLFLWNEAARLTYHRLQAGGAYEGRSLFQMMTRGMEIKLNLMKENPDLARFCLRSFLETDKEVEDAIQASYASWFSKSAAQAITQVDSRTLIPGVDAYQILEQMALAFEGHLRRSKSFWTASVDTIEKEYRHLMAFWVRAFTSEQETEIRALYLQSEPQEQPPLGFWRMRPQNPSSISAIDPKEPAVQRNADAAGRQTPLPPEKEEHPVWRKEPIEADRGQEEQKMTGPACGPCGSNGSGPEEGRNPFEHIVS